MTGVAIMTDKSKRAAETSSTLSAPAAAAAAYNDSFDDFSNTSDSDDYSDEGEFGAYLTNSDDVSSVPLTAVGPPRSSAVHRSAPLLCTSFVRSFP